MSEQEKIQKFFRAYLTQTNIRQDYAERIIKQAQHYAMKDRNKQFLIRFFEVLRKCYDGKNPKVFITACKRFLFIINKLLGEETKKEKQGKYCQIISQQIVQYYFFFFEIIFKNSLHDLIIELKMFRMKWARIITDRAFIKLRQEIFKKHKFNLDKGFSQQNMQKIKKTHQKRGLSQKQSNFYLGLQTKQQKNSQDVDQRQQPSSSSDSEQSQIQKQIPSKKVKSQIGMQNPYSMPASLTTNYDNNQGYPMKDDISYQNATNSNFSDPRKNRPGYNENSYTSQVNMNANSNFTGNLNIRQQVPNPPVNYTYSNSANAYNNPNIYIPHPNYSGLVHQQSPALTTYALRQTVGPKGQHSSIEKVNRIRQLLHNNVSKCRECGQCFQTNQNYEKHTTQHFFQALQKANEIQFKGKVQQEAKFKLSDTKSWQAVQQSDEKQYRFQVVVSEVPYHRNERSSCFFCNQGLQMSFSPKQQDWVYSDAIKIEVQGQVALIHFSCYQCLQPTSS